MKISCICTYINKKSNTLVERCAMNNMMTPGCGQLQAVRRDLVFRTPGNVGRRYLRLLCQHAGELSAPSVTVSTHTHAQHCQVHRNQTKLQKSYGMAVVYLSKGGQISRPPRAEAFSRPSAQPAAVTTHNRVCICVCTPYMSAQGLGFYF